MGHIAVDYMDNGLSSTRYAKTQLLGLKVCSGILADKVQSNLANKASKGKADSDGADAASGFRNAH